jgi:N-acetylmuramoyl-L-alanine amidase
MRDPGGAAAHVGREPGRTDHEGRAGEEAPGGPRRRIDPGHQLGNAAFPAEIGALIDAGGLRKPCNTGGTSTDDGYPEATLNWQVAQGVRRALVRLGARVRLTRSSNSTSAWGPCVDERGRAGNPGRPGPTADVKVSIHADGSYTAGARGFHVITPAKREPWTADIARASSRLAGVVRDALVAAGLAPSSYTGVKGIDERADLGTLNLSDVPTVMVELGNMRDAQDAAVMTSARGRTRYASALATAISRYLAG